MSRLSEALGVPENTPFKYMGAVYKVEGNKRYLYYKEHGYEILDYPDDERGLAEMLDNLGLIRIIPEKSKLTEQQITLIKGKIAEGLPWATKDGDASALIYFHKHKPRLSSDNVSWIPSNLGDLRSMIVADGDNHIYDFIKFENSPVYLPDLIGE